jgi:Flp pilus assembly secretin CpaC
LAGRLQPRARQLFVITGTSSVEDLRWQEAARRTIEQHWRKFETTYLFGLSHDALVTEVKDDGIPKRRAPARPAAQATASVPASASATPSAPAAPRNPALTPPTRITVGKSIVIDYPGDIRQISTSNPDVVDASPVTTREILMSGKGLGSVTMVVWSKEGQRTFYNVTVDLNLDPLRRSLRESFPNEDIHPRSSRDSITLDGRVSNKEAADRAITIAPAIRMPRTATAATVRTSRRAEIRRSAEASSAIIGTRPSLALG